VHDTFAQAIRDDAARFGRVQAQMEAGDLVLEDGDSEVREALALFVLSPGLRSWLFIHDPMALKQARKALLLDEFGKEEVGS
jgi:hypothetical protein